MNATGIFFSKQSHECRTFNFVIIAAGILQTNMAESISTVDTTEAVEAESRSLKDCAAQSGHTAADGIPGCQNPAVAAMDTIGWFGLVLWRDLFVCLFVGWLLNVPATCECISGTDLLRQFYVLPHWDRSCRSNFPPHPVIVYWHQADQSQHWPFNARHRAGHPLECQCLSHWYDLSPEKSDRKRDSNLGSSALEADTLTPRLTRRFVERTFYYNEHRGRAFQKSELKFQALQQREHRLQNCRKHSHWRWYRVATPRAPGPMSSQMALQRMLLGMEAVVLASVTQMEPPPPSPSQLVTWAPTTEQKYMPWKLPQNSWLRKTATSRISSCCLTPCLLFSLWQMAPPTFAPSSYTTACVLYQTTTE